MFGEGVPEGWGGNGESPVTPGAMLSSDGGGQEVGVSRTKGTGGSVPVEEVREIGGGQVVESFKCDEQQFEFYALFYWEPVEVLEDRSDVISFARVSEQSGSRVLYVLQFVENFGGCAVEDAIAVV